MPVPPASELPGSVAEVPTSVVSTPPAPVPLLAGPPLTGTEVAPDDGALVTVGGAAGRVVGGAVGVAVVVDSPHTSVKDTNDGATPGPHFHASTSPS